MILRRSKYFHAKRIFEINLVKLLLYKLFAKK